MDEIINKLWGIASALHTVRVHDRESLDTLVGCTATLIAMAASIGVEPPTGENEQKKEEDDG